MEAIRGDYFTMSAKKYTVEDIEKLPEGVRAELFDGEMIRMASPTTTHQKIVR